MVRREGDAVVVVPVRDGAEHLADNLPSVVDQAHAIGAVVVVVDDGSEDDSARRAADLGAVVRPGDGRGPYAARNLGWQAVDARVAVFTDVRCRPDPGWLEAAVAGLDDPEVSLVGGDVRVPPGGTAAQRAVALEQPFLASSSAAEPFLPYFPTCNLTVRRASLERVGGFRAVRSGGDLDLCWRVQLEGGGRAAIAPGATMTWTPRRRLRAGWEQFHRYGATAPGLLARFADQGCDVRTPVPPLRQVLHDLRVLVARGRARRDLPAEVVAAAYHLAFAWGYASAWREVDPAVRSSRPWRSYLEEETAP